MSNQIPTVAVVDDDDSVRKAIARLLRSAGLAVSSYASALDFLEHYDANTAGCLILDLQMPGLTGLELQDALAAIGRAPPIIFLTGCATVPDSVQALKRGAVEFLTKPVDQSTLLGAVHSAIEADRLDRIKCAANTDIQKRLALLTPREREVLNYVVLGKLNKQIAGELGTVEKTIKVHRARVMEKMQVKSLAELVMLAAQAGIVDMSLH